VGKGMLGVVLELANGFAVTGKLKLCSVYGEHAPAFVRLYHIPVLEHCDPVIEKEGEGAGKNLLPSLGKSFNKTVFKRILDIAIISKFPK
jgi:hypothetical protein